jgi:hypothetical protein
MVPQMRDHHGLRIERQHGQQEKDAGHELGDLRDGIHR